MSSDPPEQPDEAEILAQLLLPEQSVRNQQHAVVYRSAKDIEHGLNLGDIRSGQKLQARVQVRPGKPKL